MRPQEKAHNLIMKHASCLTGWTKDFLNESPELLQAVGIWDDNNFKKSKQSALVTVEEMLSHANIIWSGELSEADEALRYVYIEYWQKVNKAIETITEP